jgi:hypothetical protein
MARTVLPIPVLNESQTGARPLVIFTIEGDSGLVRHISLSGTSCSPVSKVIVRVSCMSSLHRTPSLGSTDSRNRVYQQHPVRGSMLTFRSENLDVERSRIIGTLIKKTISPLLDSSHPACGVVTVHCYAGYRQK